MNNTFFCTNLTVEKIFFTGMSQTYKSCFSWKNSIKFLSHINHFNRWSFRANVRSHQNTLMKYIGVKYVTGDSSHLAQHARRWLLWKLLKHSIHGITDRTPESIIKCFAFITNVICVRYVRLRGTVVISTARNSKSRPLVESVLSVNRHVQTSCLHWRSLKRRRMLV